MTDKSGLETLSALLGWSYMIVWSISFYPQVIANYKFKTVTGLSIDFVTANMYGMLCYTLYITGMLWSDAVRAEYRSAHDGRNNLIVTNDGLFALNALFVSSVTCVQVALYRLPHEGPSWGGLVLAGAISVLIAGGAAAVYMGGMSLLAYLSVLAYIKIVLTACKYIPQVRYNWRRRSTVGWNITNVLLDFAGGIMSIMQLLLDAYIAGDASGIIGAGAKLFLGVISVAFDIIFMLQHYVWFKDAKPVVHQIAA